MRLFVSVVFIITGICICLFDEFSHRVANASWETAYRNELQAFPVKQTYTQAELADATWQVWTNRVSLPVQSAYTPTELKEAVVRRLIATHQDSCDRSLFESTIGKVIGYQKHPGGGMAAAGVMTLFVGTFLLGGILFPSKSPPQT